MYRVWRLREGVPVSPSHLRAEGVFVQPYQRRLARAVINGHDIKPAGTFADVTFRQDFPSECVPIRDGQIVGPLHGYLTVKSERIPPL